MLSFDAPTKEFFVQRATSHQLADEIVKGNYWENGKGGAVGCLVHSEHCSDLSSQFGIPIEMAHLIEEFFDCMPLGEAKKLPVRFVKSIPVGRDLQVVMDRWNIELLSDPTHGALAFADDKTRPAIQTVIDLYRRKLSGDNPDNREWATAKDVAVDAANASASSFSARFGAWVAVWAAGRNVKPLVVSVPLGVARAAAESYAESSAESSARVAKAVDHYIWQANLLITLLESAA